MGWAGLSTNRGCSVLGWPYLGWKHLTFRRVCVSVECCIQGAEPGTTYDDRVRPDNQMNVKKAIVNAGILFFLLSIWLQGMTQLPRHRVCGFELNDTTVGDSKIFSPIHQELADNIRTNRSSVTIPVVFHLVYKNVNENIPDQVLVRQLEYLNRDFNGLNSDLANVPDHFKNLVGRANIRFCLASRDPSGFPTSGVVRIRTSMERIGVKEELHYTSRGGS